MNKILLALTIIGMVAIPTVRAAHADNCNTTCNRFGNTVNCNTYCY